MLSPLRVQLVNDMSMAQACLYSSPKGKDLHHDQCLEILLHQNLPGKEVDSHAGHSEELKDVSFDGKGLSRESQI